jgi:hypothetical protein
VSQEPEPTSTVDEEFAKISKFLDQEAAWKVETPGGGVLDKAPRPAAPAAEPRPTLGT